MIKYLQSKSFKMALSATISVFICNYLGIKFGVTSGIIAILSIQDTKREAVFISIKRIAAAIIAILLSYVLYIVLGNNPVVFGLFLLIFIPLTIKFNIVEGMVPATVLSTHLLTSSNINALWILNEILLTVVGVGVAMLFNLYSASLDEDYENNRIKIEEQYKLILTDFSLSLVTQELPTEEKEVFENTEKILIETKEMAQKISMNYLFKSHKFYLDYVDMRIAQFDTLKRMKKHFSRFYMTYNQTRMLSEFTHGVALNIYADNDCRELIEKINLLREGYKKMELPRDRREFENRALLFQFLNDLEDFLIIKKEFKDKY
ncbi:aromatic acid exporter family protein [Clostridium sp. SM-530-WT-3G]|uniref:aromatic acid exporter family protein n=1 Tax=Clostridium sp. SM-530-WT-3G TaxID=2725303 RepID=UPI00145F5245|nr:aromatic acid exporter family protein [Clostridium sp. SM-530-WT-3G]NME81826.1 aromatic acid exporter family protein [Clostridium sp. SM-530-WT-3G]